MFIPVLITYHGVQRIYFLYIPEVLVMGIEAVRRYTWRDLVEQHEEQIRTFCAAEGFEYSPVVPNMKAACLLADEPDIFFQLYCRELIELRKVNMGGCDIEL